MLMGFLNYGSVPPGRAGPGAEEPPEEPSDGSDDTGIHASVSLEAARSRYRRPGAGACRYAWLISLGLHAAVLIGALIAFRYYHQSSRLAPPVPESSGPGLQSYLSGADATDAIHTPIWFKGMTAGPQWKLAQTARDDNEPPTELWPGRSTLESLGTAPQFAAFAPPVGTGILPGDPGSLAHPRQNRSLLGPSIVKQTGTP